MIMHRSSVLLTAEQLHWKTMREKHFVSVPRLHLSQKKKTSEDNLTSRGPGFNLVSTERHKQDIFF